LKGIKEIQISQKILVDGTRTSGGLATLLYFHSRLIPLAQFCFFRSPYFCSLYFLPLNNILKFIIFIYPIGILSKVLVLLGITYRDYKVVSIMPIVKGREWSRNLFLFTIFLFESLSWICFLNYIMAL
jgi:hypothetical protein